MTDERLSEHCRDDSAVGSVEQLDLEVNFHVLYDFRGGGLGDVELPGGISDVVVSADGNYQLQLIELQP